MKLFQHIVFPGIKYNMGENIKPLSINNYELFSYVHTLQKEFGDSLFSRLRSMFLGLIIEEWLRPIDGLAFSVKVVHFMLSRRIMTTRTYELWFRFARKPMGFSLQEYYLVTCLHCRVSREEDSCSGPFIDISGTRHTCEDLLAWIKNAPNDAEACKLRLEMILTLVTLVRKGAKHLLFEYLKKNTLFMINNIPNLSLHSSASLGALLI